MTAEPRYASLPNIMKAKKKPFKKFTLADLGLEDQVKPRQEILKVAEPPKRQGGAKVRLFSQLLRISDCTLFISLLTLTFALLAFDATGGERRRAHLQAQGGWSYLSSKRHHGDDMFQHSDQKASLERHAHRLNLDL